MLVKDFANLVVQCMSNLEVVNEKNEPVTIEVQDGKAVVKVVKQTKTDAT